jgi:hypothetical protein
MGEYSGRFEASRIYSGFPFFVKDNVPIQKRATPSSAQVAAGPELDQPQNRVPHLRHDIIVAKMGTHAEREPSFLHLTQP